MPLCFCFALILFFPAFVEGKRPEEDVVDVARYLPSNFRAATFRDHLSVPAVAVAVSSVLYSGSIEGFSERDLRKSKQENSTPNVESMMLTFQFPHGVFRELRSMLPPCSRLSMARVDGSLTVCCRRTVNGGYVGT